MDVSNAIVIVRPQAQVFAFAGDPDHVCDWYANIRSVHWRTPRPAVLGSEVDYIAHFLGRRLAYTYRIVEWEPPARLAMRTADGPFPMQTHYEFTALDPQRTRVTLRNRGEPGGFFRIATPLLAMAVAAANRKDLRRLKAVLEADVTAV